MASWLEQTAAARLRAKHREHLDRLDRARFALEAALLTADRARQSRCRISVAQVVDGLKAIRQQLKRAGVTPDEADEAAV